MKQSVFAAVVLAAALAGCASGVKLVDVPVEDRSGQANTPVGTGGPVGERPVQNARIDDSASAQAGPTNDTHKNQNDNNNKANKPENQTTNEAHARYLKQSGARHVVIEGHTDERGGREYNLALGQKRSEAVRRALELLGVRDAQVEAVSFGKEKPAVQGNDESAWAQNRRAEIAYR